MQDGSGETSDELCEDINVSKATIDTTERAMRLRCASAHDILLLIILDLLRREALAIRPEKVQFLAVHFNAILAEQVCFDALAVYLHECSGLGRKAVSEDETPDPASWP